MTNQERAEKLKALREKIEKENYFKDNPWVRLKSESAQTLIDNTPDPTYWETGTVIDKLTGCGLTNKAVVLLVGGTGDGKSLLLTHLAVKMSFTKRILYLSFENASDVDSVRIKDCLKVYENTNLDNIDYINILKVEEQDPTYKWNFSHLEKIIENKDYDLICLDALQTTFDKINQEDIHKVGNEVISYLHRLATKYEIPMLITWQSSRTSAPKKLDDITTDDISASYGTIRYCSEAFFIKREKGSRKLKLLKTRNSKNVNWDDNVYNLEMSAQFSVERFGEFLLKK